MNYIEKIIPAPEFNTKQEFLDYMTNLSTLDNHIQFAIGDGILKGWEGGYVERGLYDEISNVTGMSKSTLNDYVWVAKCFKSSDRTEQLSWKHHSICAKLDIADRDSFMNDATENKWSSNMLKKEIKEWENPTEKTEENESGSYNIKYDIKCTGVSALVHKIFKQSNDDPEVINAILKEIRRLKRR